MLRSFRMQQSLERALEKPFTGVRNSTIFARSFSEPSKAIESLRMLLVILASFESVQFLCFLLASANNSLPS